LDVKFMEIRNLRSFLAVAETAHFTRAARKVHLSQSTLSHQIKELEQEIGVPLFDRGGRQVRLTAAGMILREHARRAIRTLDEAIPAIGEVESLSRGQVSVGVVQVLDSLLVPSVIAHFTGAHPGIGIRVERLWQRDIESAVRSGDIDLGICLDPPKIQGVVLDILAETPFALIVADTDLLAGRRSLGVEELGQVPLILFPPKGSWLRQLTDETFSESRIEPTCSIEMDSVEAVLATVKQGLGVAFLPVAVLGHGKAGLRAVPLEGPPIQARVGLLWRSGADRSRAAMAFAESVASVVRSDGLTPLS
jgi:LysR family cyn operon transcriptional activator